MATTSDDALAAADTARDEASEIEADEGQAPPAGDTPPAGQEGEETPVEGDGEPKPDDLSKQPPSLRAAVRLEKKAKTMRADAEAKLADVAQREAALTQRVTEAQQQQERWQREVAPKVRAYDDMQKAAKGGRLMDVLEHLGFDREKATEQFVEEARNPLSADQRAMQRRLDQLEADRKALDDQRAEQQRQVQLRQQDTREVSQALEYGAFPMLARFRAEEGVEGLMDQAYQVLKQTRAADLPTLLRDLEARAKNYYATQGASANPPPSGGRQQAGNAAPPAAAGGARRAPSAVTDRDASASGAGSVHDYDPDAARAKAIAQLRADRFGAES